METSRQVPLVIAPIIQLTPLSANFPETYDVVTNAQDANPTFANFTDHSGNGKMMAINGGLNATKVVWSQTISAQPGRLYRFKGYAASLTNVNYASLRIRVNGVNVGPANPYSLPNPGTWLDLDADYVNGNNTTLTFAIYDVNTNAIGNEFCP